MFSSVERVCHGGRTLSSTSASSPNARFQGTCSHSFQRLHRTSRLQGCRLIVRASAGPGAGRSESGSPSPVPDYLPSSASDWREFRAKLVAQGSQRPSSQHWAHHVPGPEPGCLLIAHPLMFANSQEYFARAVILLFAHDDMAGSAGLILNRKTRLQIGHVQGAETLWPEFSESPLYLGGDVGMDTTHILHPHDLENSLEVVQGVRMGGFEAAKSALAAGKLDVKDFKILTRYSGWGPGQLKKECEAGVWLTAAAPGSFMLQHDKDGDELWHEVLQLMGGEFNQLSAAMKGGYDTNVMEHPSDSDDNVDR